MTIRTRFAPSPTGYLHLGSARTALFSWLYAKHHKGEFVLRIEDTDRERSTSEAIDVILDAMAWLGMDYQATAYYQTQRFDRYKEVLDELLAAGKVYRCYCSKERLDALRAEQTEKKIKPRYDGRCRHTDVSDKDGQPFVLRFKNPESGDVVIDDQVRGKIVISNQELDDLIVARSDGTPTYNFCVVIDDMDMNITHVIRGDDHINNTPRQINIFDALDATPPLYAHIPMILGEDGKRLSKRHGAVSILEYRAQGFLPEAMLNYLVRLGWAHGDDEIFSIEEMIAKFDLSGVSKSPAAFNMDKLLWLNQHYLKTKAPDSLAELLIWHLDALGVSVDNGPAITEVIIAQRERCKTLKEMAERSRFFYEDNVEYDEEAAKKHLGTDSKDVLRLVFEKLETLDDWSKDAIHEVIKDAAEEAELKMGKVAQPIRVAVTGNTISPSIDETLRLIGKDRVLARIKSVT